MPRIIGDNGPQFIAKDFKAFIGFSGMTHVRASPYYPQSNGKLICETDVTLSEDSALARINSDAALSEMSKGGDIVGYRPLPFDDSAMRKSFLVGCQNPMAGCSIFVQITNRKVPTPAEPRHYGSCLVSGVESNTGEPMTGCGIPPLTIMGGKSS